MDISAKPVQPFEVDALTGNVTVSVPFAIVGLLRWVILLCFSKGIGGERGARQLTHGWGSEES